jgi:hypothetical protein
MVVASLKPFVQPATNQLSSVVLNVCRTVYDENTVLGRHIQGVFGKLEIPFPALTDVSAQLLGLENALTLFPDLFSTQEEFSTFLANVLCRNIRTYGRGIPLSVSYKRDMRHRFGLR